MNKVDTVTLTKLIKICPSAESVRLTYNRYNKRGVSLSTVYRYAKNIIHRFVRGIKTVILTQFEMIMYNISINKRASGNVIARLKTMEGYNKCAICGEDFLPCLEVHHINWNSKDTRIGNLMTVCSCCHSKIHLGKEKPFYYADFSA